MNRIKLPGKEKNKRILLILLVILSIGVLFHEAWINGKFQNKVQKEMTESKDTEESYINDVANKETQSIDNNKSQKGQNDDNKINQKENKYSDKENQLYNEAYTLFFSHEYIKAIDKATILISEFPNNAMGYNIRGIAKSYSGDYDGGMKDIDAALSIDENYGYARFNKALTYELHDNMNEALTWYNKALEVEDYVWSYYGISSIYGRRGDVANTMIYLNKAIDMDPGVRAVAKTERDFDSVKDSKEFQNAIYN